MSNSLTILHSYIIVKVDDLISVLICTALKTSTWAGEKSNFRLWWKRTDVAVFSFVENPETLISRGACGLLCDTPTGASQLGDKDSDEWPRKFRFFVRVSVHVSFTNRYFRRPLHACFAVGLSRCLPSFGRRVTQMIGGQSRNSLVGKFLFSQQFLMRTFYLSLARGLQSLVQFAWRSFVNFLYISAQKNCPTPGTSETLSSVWKVAAVCWWHVQLPDSQWLAT